MRELSLNILDIAQNSIKAGAKLVTIEIAAEGNELLIAISDDGKGMDAEFVKRVIDPFTTTRTTRKVGMGIPLFKMGAEMAGGSFRIESEVGKGTIVTATYRVDNVDRNPLGDVAETVASLILGAPHVDYKLIYRVDGREFIFETSEFRELFGEVPLTEYDVIQYIKKHITEEITTVNGGRVI